MKNVWHGDVVWCHKVTELKAGLQTRRNFMYKKLNKTPLTAVKETVWMFWTQHWPLNISQSRCIGRKSSVSFSRFNIDSRLLSLIPSCSNKQCFGPRSNQINCQIWTEFSGNLISSGTDWLIPPLDKQHVCKNRRQKKQQLVDILCLLGR